MRRAIPAVDRRSVVALLGFLLLCFGVAALASAVTQPAIGSWYAGLDKPAFTPPNWVFGPAWSILYVLMAVAAWRVWRTTREAKLRRRAHAAFATQLGLNLAWSFAFFGAKSPIAGLVVIVALEIAILITAFLFAKLDWAAAWLLAPYAAWVGYAFALNLGVVVLN